MLFFKKKSALQKILTSTATIKKFIQTKYCIYNQIKKRN